MKRAKNKISGSTHQPDEPENDDHHEGKGWVFNLAFFVG